MNVLLTGQFGAAERGAWADALAQACPGVRWLDDDAARAALQGMGMPEPLLSWMVALGPLVRSGLGHEPSDDVQRLTGRAPRSLEDFVRENAQVWR